MSATGGKTRRQRDNHRGHAMNRSPYQAAGSSIEKTGSAAHASCRPPAATGPIAHAAPRPA
jgi:hypothetical protein